MTGPGPPERDRVATHADAEEIVELLDRLARPSSQATGPPRSAVPNQGLRPLPAGQLYQRGDVHQHQPLPDRVAEGAAQGRADTLPVGVRSGHGIQHLGDVPDPQLE